jgi:hypothetical protein
VPHGDPLKFVQRDPFKDGLVYLDGHFLRR